MQTVTAAFEAVRANHLDRLLPLFAENCVVALPGETYEGREGIRAWYESRIAGRGPKVSAGEPEAVDEMHVLVPLSVEISLGGVNDTVRATGVWTVVGELITTVRAVPGGRRMALASFANENS